MKIIGNIKPLIFSVIKSHIDDRLIVEERDMRIGEVCTHSISEEALRKIFINCLTKMTTKQEKVVVMFLAVLLPALEAVGIMTTLDTDWWPCG
jgi:hypothetical protein